MALSYSVGLPMLAYSWCLTPTPLSSMPYPHASPLKANSPAVALVRPGVMSSRVCSLDRLCVAAAVSCGSQLSGCDASRSNCCLFYSLDRLCVATAVACGSQLSGCDASRSNCCLFLSTFLSVLLFMHYTAVIQFYLAFTCISTTLSGFLLRLDNQ